MTFQSDRALNVQNECPKCLDHMMKCPFLRHQNFDKPSNNRVICRKSRISNPICPFSRHQYLEKKSSNRTICLKFYNRISEWFRSRK